MPQWVDIGGQKDFPVGSQKCMRIEGQPLAVFNLDETGLTAILNICPHAGLPLGDGPVEGKVLTCPYHGYAYNLETGKNVDFEGDVPLKRYPIRIENDRVMVELASTKK